VLLLLAGPAAVPLGAQDEGLDLLLLGRLAAPSGATLEGRTVQVYRIPIGFTVRNLEDRRWGLRITTPVSFGVHELQAATDLEDLVARLDTATVTPGVEFLVPLGERWMLKPFAEVGVTGSRSGGGEALYAGGVRTRGDYVWSPFHVTLGGAAKYKSARTNRALLADYSTLEIGADAQVPLGFGIGARRALGGAYAVVHHFPGTELDRPNGEPLKMQWLYEVGVSFSTDPVLRLWKVKLPWIALGYRFGDVFSGVRLSFSFPF
jgi:hypothetical protein